MKKALIYLLAAAMVIGATACASSKKDYASKTKTYASASSAATAGVAGKAVENRQTGGGGLEASGKTNQTTAMTDAKDNIGIPQPQPQSGTNPNQPQKLVYYIDYNIETIDFDGSVAKIEEIAAKYNGLIENSSFSSGGSSYKANVGLRTASYTLRIPSEKLAEFEAEFGNVGNVLNRSKSVQDMSKQYYDTQARIDALKTQQKRLLELLQQAKDMTDIIAIEQKLSDVNYQLDSFTADNRYIDDLVNFSTVNISLREVLKEQVINNAPKNIFEEIGQNFKKSMRDVANSARELVVTVIGNLPEILTALAVWAAVIFAGYRIYKAAKKRIFGKSASQPVKDGGDKTKE